MLPPGFKANLQLVRDPAGIAALSAKLSAVPVIGVDTEFIREKTFYPAIALIQVAGRPAP